MGESSELDQPADTMWERAGESAAKVWFLVSAPRSLVILVISFATYALLVGMGVLGPSGFEQLFQGDSIDSVFGSVIIAVVTSVTLVLTVAQLVLSEQIDELGQHRDRMDGEVEFREHVEDMADIDVSPVEPHKFLQTLLVMVEDRANAIAEDVREQCDEEELSTLLAFLDELAEESRETMEELEGTEFGSFQVLLPVLNYNYSWKIHCARAMYATYGDDIPREVDELYEELIESLHLFAPTREYFKSQYFQWEIINISRATLYGAAPALAVSGYMILAFDASGISGSFLGVTYVYLGVSAMYVLALLPFIVLLAYILRILTVIKRTLSIGPFVLRESEVSESIPNVGHDR